MMAVAAAIGVQVGIGYNGTLYLLTLTISGCSVMCCVATFTWVRRDGDIARHG
jgi:hypothetical protein